MKSKTLTLLLAGHLGATGVGMVISAPALATLMLNVPLGRLCDTVGRPPVPLLHDEKTNLLTAGVHQLPSQFTR